MIITLFVDKHGETKEIKNIVDDVDDDKLRLYIETLVSKMYSQQLSKLTKITVKKENEHIFIFDDDDNENNYYYYVKERELMLRFMCNAFESAYSAEKDLRDIEKRLEELK